MKATLIFLLIVSSFSFQANDEKAKALLESSSGKFKSLADFSASLQLTFDAPHLDSSVVKKGTVKISGNKYHLNFLDEESVCNGTYCWIILHRQESVMITDAGYEESFSISDLYNMLKTDLITLRYDGTDSGFERVTITFADVKSDYSRILVWLGANRLIAKAKLHARNGSMSTYEFSDIKTNTGINSSEFEVNISQFENREYEITDIRE